jgi:hypothetical protein
MVVFGSVDGMEDFWRQTPPSHQPSKKMATARPCTGYRRAHKTTSQTIRSSPDNNHGNLPL